MTICERTFLQLIRASLGDVPEDKEVQLAAEDWQAVFDLAEQHHVLPLVLDTTFRLGIIVPNLVFRVYKQRARQIVSIQAAKTASFLSLYQYLKGQGLQPLVMKGLICRELYPVPDFRFSADEDLLIPKEQIAVYHDALTAYGLKADRSTDEVLTSFETGYTSEDRLLYIELHCTPFSPDSNAYCDYNQFFEDAHRNSISTVIQGNAFETLGQTDHLLYLICHALKHFLHGGFGIRQVCDICLFARQNERKIDWGRLDFCLKSVRAGRFTAALFAIGNDYLGIALPEAEEAQSLWNNNTRAEELLLDILSSGVYGSSTLSRKHSSGITLHAMEKGNAEESGRPGIQILFPPIASMRRRYPYLKRYPFLLPIAWTQRITGYLGSANRTDNSTKEALELGRKRVALLKQYGLLGKWDGMYPPDQPERSGTKGASGQRVVDTGDYISSLLELIREGHEVSLPVVGSSMVPFLADGRDRVFLNKPSGKLRRGDIILYQRKNGDYVLHRIYRVHKGPDAELYDVIGDAQNRIEYGISGEQVFAKAERVERKGKIKAPGSLYWWFFRYIWVDLIPLRHLFISIYSTIR